MVAAVVGVGKKRAEADDAARREAAQHLYSPRTVDQLLEWVRAHQAPRVGGIVISTARTTIYPEVSGYFIPTLLQAGHHALANKFGEALLLAQFQDGSFGLGG